MSHRTVLTTLSILIGVTFRLAYSTSREPGVGWIHLVGLGLSVLLLAVIGLGKVPGISKSPPD
jgi:hypothetical protein